MALRRIPNAIENREVLQMAGKLFKKKCNDFYDIFVI